MTTFSDLGLCAPLCKALESANYVEPTPIQVQAIPPLLERRDVLGCAQTGTGKTAAFALPVLQHLTEDKARRGKPRIRALVLTPTRELAAQIEESFTAYGEFLHTRHAVIFGGVNENPQIQTLRRGVDILVATPGRLLDLQGRGFVDLSNVDFFVLDEADRMLDMGFVHDVRRVIDVLPRDRQNLLFSATMPQSIVRLAASFLVDPVHVEVTPQATTVEQVEQTVMFVERTDKKLLLAELLKGRGVRRSIVFTRTKHGANRLSQQLDRAGIHSAAIHGNKSQAARKRALDGFRHGDVPVLIATDIAARGIDVNDVTHVFNYELPNIPESYVHRVGRTARAGRDGVAISFCDSTEGEYLREIEKTVGMELFVDDEHGWHSDDAEEQSSKPAPKSTKRDAGSRTHRNRPGNRRGSGGRRRGPRKPGQTAGAAKPQRKAASTPQPQRRAPGAAKPQKAAGTPKPQGRGGKRGGAGATTASKPGARRPSRSPGAGKKSGGSRGGRGE